MNRRALLFAGLAAISATALDQVRAKPRRATRPRRAPASAPRFRTVTRTFTSDLPFTIPGSGSSQGPAQLYPSTIVVSGLTGGVIEKVTVSLNNLRYTVAEDLDIMLVAPDNTGIILLSDAGGGSSFGATLVFDQDAPDIPPAVLRSGTFQPANFIPVLETFPAPAPTEVTGHSLTVFNNRNPNGLWQLFIFDDFDQQSSGALGGWSLTIRARIPVPRRRRRRPNRRPARRAQR